MKLVVGIAAPLAGIAMILFVCRRWMGWRRARNWRPVRVRILDARLRVEKELNQGLDLYIPVVEYRYACGGREFIGHKITFHDRHLRSVFVEEAQAVLDRIDLHPDVYVDPSEPRNAVLLNRLEKAHVDYLLTRIVLGVLLVLVGIAFFVRKQ